MASKVLLLLFLTANLQPAAAPGTPEGGARAPRAQACGAGGGGEAEEGAGGAGSAQEAASRGGAEVSRNSA